ncbi:MAG: hypothetical protein IPM80_20145 [Proteobacteria bacterium]|jgi:hypothetical protein|nr:hypothetical protein [Pseudomonadota bacterium]
MRNHQKVISSLPPGSSSAPATRRLIEGYATEIAARRQQLLDDRALYRGKLEDLRDLDPADFTGLTKLYRAHLTQIELLLKEFDRPARGA